MTSTSSSSDLPAPEEDRTAKRPDSGIGESVIRLMTRLSMQHGAVNLSQGFPNEPPPLSIRLALARAVLAGVPEDLTDTSATCASIENMLKKIQDNDEDEGTTYSTSVDELNQYSPPMGRSDLRAAIAAHYKRLYDYDVDPDQGITVTLGATEAVASALRTVGRPGDKAVIFEPYHELYPSQTKIFYMEPEYVTLREDPQAGTWAFCVDELAVALEGAKVLLLNTPHNPTGKVFTHDELRIIVDLCIKHDVYIITDEIYDGMTYEINGTQHKHILLPREFPHVVDRTLVCNSVGKSASATGWRLGWCLMPPHLTETYRGVHDQLVVMAPHPIQYAGLTYFDLPKEYFTRTLSTRYIDRLNTLASSLRKVGFKVLDPEGAYYLFVKYRSVQQLSEMGPWDASMYMVKEVGVACVPGTNFYGSDHAMQNEAQEYLRFAACRSVKDIEAACEKLEATLSKGKT